MEIYWSGKVSVYSYTLAVTAGFYVSFMLSERPNQYVRITVCGDVSVCSDTVCGDVSVCSDYSM